MPSMIKQTAPPSARVPLWLLAAFAVIWLALAIAPRYRADWLLENVLVLVVVPWLVWAWRRLPLSNGAYVAIFCFLVLHLVGAHYTYSEVPYDQWSQAVFGHSPGQLLGFERNHYDRLVHFLYGVLVMPAAVELLAARAPSRGGWAILLPICFVMSHSVIYETIEWLAAEVFGGDLGIAYLGTQGDVWDAHKDMALAALGAVLARLALAWPARGVRPGAER